MSKPLAPLDLSALLAPAQRGLEEKKQFAPFYPALCEASRIIAESDMARPLDAIAHLSYGWMPTILKSTTRKDQRALVDAVRNIHNIGAASRFVKDELKKPPVNNSWVGTSKVFHFIAPNAFPIWDSRVARHWRRSVNSRPAYLAYLDYVRENSADKSVAVFRQQVKAKWEHPVGQLRALELMLYLSTP